MGLMQYRLWNDRDKMMVYFNDQAFTEHYSTADAPAKLMRFTGVYDANKMPIYENDILLERLEDHESNTIIETEYEVFYSDEHAAFMIDESFNKDKSQLFPLAEALVTSRYKVIRNIYR